VTLLHWSSGGQVTGAQPEAGTFWGQASALQSVLTGHSEGLQLAHCNLYRSVDAIICESERFLTNLRIYRDK